MQIREAKIREALQLITESKNGTTFNEIKARGYGSTPDVLISRGMIFARRGHDGVLRYHATARGIR